MGLKEVQEELKEQIKKAETTETEQPQEEVKQDDKPVEEIVQTAKEEPKQEEVKAEEPVKTSADYAKERREKLKLKKENEELERARSRIAELEALVVKPAQKHEQEKQDLPPNREEDPAAYAEWRASQAEKEAKIAQKKAEELDERVRKQEQKVYQDTQRQQAQRELLDFETEVKNRNADYDEAKNFLVNQMAYSIKTLNPRISNDALVHAVDHQIMVRAAQFMNDGWENPVEGMLQELRESGWKPQPKQEDIKPDLSKVAKNRERNSGMAGAASGTGRGEITRQVAAQMTVAEWAKLSSTERQRLLKSA